MECKRIYDRKKGVDGKVDTSKGRIIVKVSSSKKPRIDYKGTFLFIVIPCPLKYSYPI